MTIMLRTGIGKRLSLTHKTHPTLGIRDDFVACDFDASTASCAASDMAAAAGCAVRRVAALLGKQRRTQRFINWSHKQCCNKLVITVSEQSTMLGAWWREEVVGEKASQLRQTLPKIRLRMHIVGVGDRNITHQNIRVF